MNHSILLTPKSVLNVFDKRGHYSCTITGNVFLNKIDIFGYELKIIEPICRDFAIRAESNTLIKSDQYPTVHLEDKLSVNHKEFSQGFDMITVKRDQLTVFEAKIPSELALLILSAIYENLELFR
jgi:hypothetical protein